VTATSNEKQLMSYTSTTYNNMFGILFYFPKR